MLPPKSKENVAGSGTAATGVSNIKSSKVKESPNGSPVMLIREIPVAKINERTSFELLPGISRECEVTGK